MENATARPWTAQVDDSGYTASGAWSQRLIKPTSREQALNALTRGVRTVYACRMPDGAVKIGCTVDLANRMSALHAELLGFMPGDFTVERGLHQRLKAHRVRGYEYYRPHADVYAIVNEIRDWFHLPHLAA